MCTSTLSFLKVSESKVVKNRVHLDVQAGGGRGEPWEVRWPRVIAAVDRLIAAGATVIREDMQDGIPDHVVMADPEGNEFCVLWSPVLARKRMSRQGSHATSGSTASAESRASPRGRIRMPINA
jgi:hypothetical protein